MSFEQSCMETADPMFFLNAIRNADCPGDMAGGSSGAQAATWQLAIGTSISCSEVCSGAGRTCTNNDWGVHDEADFRAALTVAGGDVGALCSGGFGGDIWDGYPSIRISDDRCYYNTGTSSNCFASDSNYRPLCHCQVSGLSAASSPSPAPAPPLAVDPTVSRALFRPSL